VSARRTLRAAAALATAVMALAAAVPATAQLSVNKPADLTKPIVLNPKQGAIVVGFRRPDKMSAGKTGLVAFARYDVDKRDIVAQPRHAKKEGDTTTYWVQVRSGDKTLAGEYLVLPVTAGDYVLFGATPMKAPQVANTFCLGAPAFHVAAGEVVYFGDLTPYPKVRLVDGTSTQAMAWSSHPDAAKAALAGKQGAIATALKPAELRNEATYGCAGLSMTAYMVPGAPTLPPAAEVSAERK
jgi:hypothetical protein